jgi:hypothetical protein
LILSISNGLLFISNTISNNSVLIPANVIETLNLEELLGDSNVKLGKAELNVVIASLQLFKGIFEWISSYDLSANITELKSLFNSNESFTIDLKDITDSVTWIYTDRLDDCFSYDKVPWKLSIDTKEELLSAKLFVNYLPTIWADENDWVLQLIQFSSLRSVGTKDVIIDWKAPPITTPTAKSIIFPLVANSLNSFNINSS